MNFGAEKLLCGWVYRPPLSTRSDFDQEILSALIKTSEMKYDGFIICGDFNHTSLSWSDEGQPYLNATLGGNAVSYFVMPPLIFTSLSECKIHNFP